MLHSEGREIRTIGLDTERDRIPLVAEAFELYATGEYTLDTLTEAMLDRGLTRRATPSKPERPIDRTTLGDMLRNRFYIGEVKYKGAWHPGRHETFISPELFDRVQRVMDSHSGAGVRTRKLNHYLRGVFRCARCNSRMIYLEVTRPSGIYAYFYCNGTKLKNCDQPYVDTETLERELIAHYAVVRLDEAFRTEVAAAVDTSTRDEQVTNAQIEARISKRLSELDTQEDRYLDLIGDPDWPQSKIKQKLATVRQERSRLTGQLTEVRGVLDVGRQLLTDALELLTSPQELYRQLPDAERRLMTLTIFGETLKVDTKQIVGHELQQPFSELLDVAQRHRDTSSKTYQRRVGRLDSHWQGLFDELAVEMKKGAPQSALPWDKIKMNDLLELALLGGQSSHKAAMVETLRRYANMGALADDLRSASFRLQAQQPHRSATTYDGARAQRFTLDLLTPEQIGQLLASSVGGATLNRLAADFGISRSSVQRVLRRHRRTPL